MTITKETKNLLETQENKITELFKGEQNNILKIGEELEVIYKSKSFELAGCKSFNQYITSGRLPFPKSTASEYRTIYQTWNKYKVHLIQLGFTPAKGVRKLLKLEDAWKNIEDKKGLVEKMDALSLRDFELYVNHATHKSTLSTPDQIEEVIKPSNINWDKELGIKKSKNNIKTKILPIYINDELVMEIKFHRFIEYKHKIVRNIEAIIKNEEK